MRINNILASAVIAVVAVTAPLAASASTLVVSETLDLKQLVFGKNGFTAGVQDFGPFSPTFSGTLSAGDTFDFTIKFLPGQTLTLTDPSLIWAFSYATDGVTTDVNGTGALTLFGASGAPLLTSDTKSDTEGSYHFGQYFSPSDFSGGLPTSLTISGLEYVGVLDSYVDPTVTTRTYGDPALFVSAGAASVPEPATWAMMLVGFSGLGAALRSSRRRPSAAAA